MFATYEACRLYPFEGPKIKITKLASTGFQGYTTRIIAAHRPVNAVIASMHDTMRRCTILNLVPTAVG